MAPKCDIEGEKSTSLYAFNFHVMLLNTYQCFLNSKNFGEKKNQKLFFMNHTSKQLFKTKTNLTNFSMVYFDT